MGGTLWSFLCLCKHEKFLFSARLEPSYSCFSWPVTRPLKSTLLAVSVRISLNCFCRKVSSSSFNCRYASINCVSFKRTCVVENGGHPSGPVPHPARERGALCVRGPQVVCVQQTTPRFRFPRRPRHFPRWAN